MDEDRFFQKYAKTREVGIPQMKMNKPVVPKGRIGKIGLELELEGTRLQLADGHFDGIKGAKTLAYWTGHADGSLRNGGREFVLSTPCNPKEVDSLLEGLFERIKANRGIIENSNRCSTHVHINVGGKKVNEITSAIAAWYIFEDALINWCGEERKSNHFCLALSECQSTLQAWRAFLSTGKCPMAEGLKYSALNLLPIWKFGSIEFRCGPAVHEPETPAMWAKFLSGLVDYATKTFPNPENIAAVLSERGPSRVFQDICEKAEVPLFEALVKQASPDFDDLCMKGLRNTQPIILGFPWTEWMDQINKEYVPNPFSGGVTKTGIFGDAPAPQPGPFGRGARAAFPDEPDPAPEPARPRQEAIPTVYADRDRQAVFEVYFRRRRENGHGPATSMRLAMDDETRNFARRHGGN